MISKCLQTTQCKKNAHASRCVGKNHSPVSLGEPLECCIAPDTRKAALIAHFVEHRDNFDCFELHVVSCQYHFAPLWPRAHLRRVIVDRLGAIHKHRNIVTGQCQRTRQSSKCSANTTVRKADESKTLAHRAAALSLSLFCV